MPFRHHRDDDAAFVIGALTVRIHLWACSSLRDKRALARKVAARLEQRFKTAVVEAGDVDDHRVLTIGLAVVARDEPEVHRQMEAILHELDGFSEGEVTDVQREAIHV